MRDWGWEDSYELRDITAYTTADCYYTDFLEERGHLGILRDYMRTYVGGEAAGLLRPWETPPSLLPNDEDIDIFTARKSVEYICLLYTSPSPRDLSTSRMPSSA